MSKMSFKICKKDLKVTEEGLVIFKLEIKSLKVEDVIVMIACLKILNCSIAIPCLFYLLENLNTPIENDLMCF